MTDRSSKLPLLLLALVVAGASWLPRHTLHRRERIPEHAGWITTDPDSLYHARRVERALDSGLSVAGTDPLLSHPGGARIPWPPYYTNLVAGLVAPFAPEDATRHGWIERRTASFPIVFGVLTSLLAGLAGWCLAGTFGGVFAGAYHAFTMGSIGYSKLGNGDHHAWVSLLSTALLALMSAALARGATETARRGLAWGAGLGLIAGLALGCWVGSLMYIVGIQLALGWLLVVNGRKTLVGLPAFGLAFHLTALAVILPAAISSPWRDELPWMVINLSWFHPAFLLVGALVFAPLAFVSPRARRVYPMLVAAGLALLAALLFALDAGPAAGIREGLDWVSRADAFMAGIKESDALIGDGAGWRVARDLGWAALLFPIAWLLLCRDAFAMDVRATLPWAVGAFLLAAQAISQARFVDSLAAPLAVTLAFGARRVPGSAALRRVPARAWPALALLAVLVMQWSTVAATIERFGAAGPPPRGPVSQGQRAQRILAEWIRRNAPDTQDGVLAPWDAGHAIEWGAGRPSVATNFGSYVGVESFLAPAHFFVADDPATAEALLIERDVRWVLLTSRLPNDIPSMVRAVAPERESAYVAVSPSGSVGLSSGWLVSMAARLVCDGKLITAPDMPSLGFLRLAAVTAGRDPRANMQPLGKPLRTGWLWERVSGAIVEAKGTPGIELRVELALAYPTAHEITWTGIAVADATGVARLRVPYSTEARGAAHGHIVGKPRWAFDGREGTLEIAEVDVLEGRTVRVP